VDWDSWVNWVQMRLDCWRWRLQVIYIEILIVHLVVGAFLIDATVMEGEISRTQAAAKCRCLGVQPNQKGSKV